MEKIRVEFVGVGLLVVDGSKRRAESLLLNVERAGGSRHLPVLVIQDHQELGGDPPDFSIQAPETRAPSGVWSLDGAVLELDPEATSPSLNVVDDHVERMIPQEKETDPSAWASLQRMPDIVKLAEPTTRDIRREMVIASVVMPSGQLAAAMPVVAQGTVRFFDGEIDVLGGEGHFTGHCVWTKDVENTHEIVIRRDYSRRRIIVGSGARLMVSNQCVSAAIGDSVTDFERVYEMIPATRRPRPVRLRLVEFPDNVNCGQPIMRL